MFLAHRLKLLRRLRLHYVVVPVKMQSAFSAAEARYEGRGGFVACVYVGRRGGELMPFAGEACVKKLPFQKIRASLIILSRRIFRADADKLCQQRSHLVFARFQPGE